MTRLRTFLVASIGALTAAATLAVVPPAAQAAPPSSAQPWLQENRTSEERALALVDQLSLEQKVTVIDQNSGTGVPELASRRSAASTGAAG